MKVGDNLGNRFFISSSQWGFVGSDVINVFNELFFAFIVTAAHLDPCSTSIFVQADDHGAAEWASTTGFHPHHSHHSLNQRF